MTHRHPVSLLEDFVDRELTPSEVEELEALLSESPELREELEATRRLKELLARHHVPDPGENYFDDAMRIILARTSEAGKIERIPAGERQKQDRRLFYRSLISAAASVMLFVGAVWLGTQHQALTTRQRVPEVMVTSTVADQLGEEPGTQLVTSEEQVSLHKGLFLLSPPGTSGRFLGLYESLELK